MKLSFSGVWHLLRKAVDGFLAHNATQLAAALALYTALSFAPLLVVVISIAGMIFGNEAARGELLDQLKDLTGPEGAKVAETVLANSQPQHGGLIAGVISVGTLIISSIGVFTALQDALNTVWSVQGKQSKSGFWRAIKDRLLSFSMVCGLAFLLLVSLIFTAVLNALNGILQRWMPESVNLLQVANILLGVALTFLMFAMIYKVLPHVKLAWSDVWFGAAITTGLFAVGKYLIGLYLGHVSVGSTFGAAGSFVVLLLWLYYSSVIMLFGAEFTQVYATRHGTAVGGAQVEGAAPGVTSESPKPQPA